MKSQVLEIYTELGKILNKTFENIDDLNFKIKEIKKIIYEELPDREIIKKIEEIVNE